MTFDYLSFHMLISKHNIAIIICVLNIEQNFKQTCETRCTHIVIQNLDIDQSYQIQMLQ